MHFWRLGQRRLGRKSPPTFAQEPLNLVPMHRTTGFDKYRPREAERASASCIRRAHEDQMSCHWVWGAQHSVPERTGTAGKGRGLEAFTRPSDSLIFSQHFALFALYHIDPSLNGAIKPSYVGGLFPQKLQTQVLSRPGHLAFT